MSRELRSYLVGALAPVALLVVANMAACSVGKPAPEAGGANEQSSDQPADNTPSDRPVGVPSDTPSDSPSDIPTDTPSDQPNVPIDPNTGKPVPQDIAPEVKAEFGFLYTIPAGAEVTKNGIVQRCYLEYTETPAPLPEPLPEPEVVGDAGAPLADAGPLPEPTPAPVPPPIVTSEEICVNQFELVFNTTWTNPATGREHEYDLSVLIDPVDDGRNPNITEFSTQNSGGAIAILAHNIQGGTGTSGWVTDATALAPAQNGLHFQMQLNAKIAPDLTALRAMFQSLLSSFKTVPVAAK